MSRPKGSKNKVKLGVLSVNEVKEVEEKNTISGTLLLPGLESIPAIIKRGRGRPKKILVEDELEIKKDNTLYINGGEVKKEIKRLKKLKLQCRAGTPERISLGRQIKDLKKVLTEQKQLEPEKESYILEILALEEQYKITPKFIDIGIDLHKFSLKELAHHLEKIKVKYGK